jgi:hypothetical protein
MARIPSQRFHCFEDDGRQQRMMEEKQVGEKRRGVDKNSFIFFLSFLSIRK